MGIKKSAVAACAAVAMSVAMAAPAMAVPNQAGGAAGVIAAVVQVDRTLNDLSVLSDVGEINIVQINDSLNNALQHADVLSNNVVTVQNFLNNCTLVSCIEITNVLNNNDVAISDVVAIDVLSGGDITVFAQ